MFLVFLVREILGIFIIVVVIVLRLGFVFGVKLWKKRNKLNIYIYGLFLLFLDYKECFL